LIQIFYQIFFGPSDWLIDNFDSHIRRAFGFWVIIFAVIGAVFWGDKVLYVTVLSVLALIPNYTSETPVEEEE
jgi:hypothetical protein